MRRTFLAVSLATCVAAAGCGYSTTAVPRRGQLAIVAAENFWGSIAAQLGGDRVALDSVIVDPGTDPHSYTATPADGIAMGGARLAIVNGTGYDSWASKLLAATPSADRSVLDVGSLLGLREGDNPHQWYSPDSVRRVAAAISADLERLDPAGRGYYEQRRTRFLDVALAPYDALLRSIRRDDHGVPVGYSESIFAPLGTALGLRLLTPPRFAKAVAEGTDVAAADLRTVQAQANRHEIRVWIYNRQNATPDVQRVTAAARAAGIPVVTITETLDPASDSFEQWQVAQLQALQSALRGGPSR